jgi:hypothetical protein
VASYCRLPTRLDISISRGEGSSRADTTSSYAYVPGPLRVFEDVIADCRRCQSRSSVKGQSANDCKRLLRTEAGLDRSGETSYSWSSLVVCTVSCKARLAIPRTAFVSNLLRTCSLCTIPTRLQYTALRSTTVHAHLDTFRRRTTVIFAGVFTNPSTRNLGTKTHHTWISKLMLGPVT